MHDIPPPIRRLLVAGLLSLPASAALADAASARTITVYDGPATVAFNEKHHFGINAELNRAWTNLVFKRGDDDPLAVKRVTVPGLRYAPDRNAVIYAADGSEVVCATVQTRQFLGMTSRRQQATGNCNFQTRTEQVRVDNGFDIETRERVRVELRINPTGNTI